MFERFSFRTPTGHTEGYLPSAPLPYEPHPGYPAPIIPITGRHAPEPQEVRIGVPRRRWFRAGVHAAPVAGTTPPREGLSFLLAQVRQTPGGPVRAIEVMAYQHRPPNGQV